MNHEHLPTGPWTGFFLEFHNPERGWMHLYLEFEQGSIRGEGTDYVGPWHINGSYDSEQGECRWIKQYLGQHQVEYTGKITQDGILGRWKIATHLDGQFHIWPTSRGDIQQRYMEEDLPQYLDRG